MTFVVFYDVNVVSDNILHGFSDVEKNLPWKVTIIFPYLPNSSFFP